MDYGHMKGGGDHPDIASVVFDENPFSRPVGPSSSVDTDI